MCKRKRYNLKHHIQLQLGPSVSQSYNSMVVCKRRGFFYKICWDDKTETKTLAYIGTMDCQFLRTVVVRKGKRLRNKLME